MADIPGITTIINPGSQVVSTIDQPPVPVVTQVLQGNEVTTVHNTVPQVVTIIQPDTTPVTSIIQGNWDVVWSVNGQTGDVIVDMVATDFLPNTTYQKDAVIVYEGELYRAIDNVTTGETFDPTEWEKIVQSSKTHPYTSLERLGSYIYRISFENIPEYDGGEIVPTGCSSLVADGKLYRNLDWYYDESPTFLVECKGFMGTAINNAITDTNLIDEELAKLPYRMTDGINDYGIMTSAHVLYNDWDWHGSGEKNVPLATVTYHILTKVKSMDTIATDLADVIPNISVNATLETSEYLMQFVITDGETTYVLTPPTTSNGTYALIDITENPKLTNFRWVEYETVTRNANYMQDRPTGVERWNEMTEDFSELRFTKAYEQPTRLSEFIGLHETTKASTDAELMVIYEEAHDKYLERERDGSLWQTTHSVVYSQKGLEALFVQENWKRNFAAPAGEKGEKGDKGDTGEQGPQGEQGPAGADGLTTSVTINGTTYTQSGGNVDLGSNYAVDASYTHTDNNYTTAEKNDVAEIDGIMEKIPNQATASNQLADKDFVNSSINSVTAFYITINAQGDQFATKAQLDATTVFYSGGEIRVPTRNDYCIVLADETQTDPTTGESPTTRYIYQNGWEFQYVVNKTTLTAAQLAAVNSGITAAAVTKLNGIAAGAEVNVQSNWTQTNTSADDYIKNKPTIGNATLTIQKNGSQVGTFTANATSNKTINITTSQANWNQNSSSAEDYIKNKPTIPTVNNATLTIQRNGTNVQTFTANSSTNKTANIECVTSTDILETQTVTPIVTTGLIVNNAVTTAKILDGSVTADKIDFSTIVDIIGISTGENQNYALKFADGRLICCIKKTLTNQNITNSWGGLYCLDILSSSIGSFAATFKEVPACNITATAGNSSIIIGTYQNPTITSPGGLTLVRPQSLTGLTINVNVIAFGFWK